MLRGGAELVELAELPERVGARSPDPDRLTLERVGAREALARSLAAAVRVERSAGFRGRVDVLGVRSDAGLLDGARSARVPDAARRGVGSARRTGVSQ